MEAGEQAPDLSSLSSVPRSSVQTNPSTNPTIFDQLSSAAAASLKHDQHDPPPLIALPPTTEHDVYAIPTSPLSHAPSDHTEDTTLKRSHEDDDIQDEAPAPKKTTRKPPRKTKAPPKKRKTKQPTPTNEDDTTEPPAAPPKRAPRAKPTPKEPAPPSRARSTRTRKAPERFEDTQAVSTATATSATTKKSTSRVFDPTFITTNSASRLVTADAYHLLLAPSAWTCLTAAQQHELVAMLPASAANTALLERIDAGETQDTRPREFSLGNDCFRTDVAKFQTDLGNGHLSKTWQAAAKQAVLERANGEYDEWKRDEAEAWWGQKADVK